jgi:hypothetical protein
MHAMQAGIHSTLGSSPGALVFNRDMLLNIPLIADWPAITQKQEHWVNQNLIWENKKRQCYDYVQVQKILKKRHGPWKLGQRTGGTYKVLQTHSNGTLTIELKHNVTERINTQQVIPYNEPT